MVKLLVSNICLKYGLMNYKKVATFRRLLYITYEEVNLKSKFCIKFCLHFVYNCCSCFENCLKKSKNKRHNVAH